MTAEGWLAERGFTDSRPHSSVEIAQLLEEYYQFRTTVCVLCGSRTDYQPGPGTCAVCIGKYDREEE